MKSGIIAVVESDDLLTDFHGELPLNEEQPFEDVKYSVNVRNDVEIADGRKAQVGRAALEDVQDRTVTDIGNNGDINQQTTIDKVTNSTEFVYVPDSFIAVENSAGSFLFELLQHQTALKIVSVEINVDRFDEANEDGLTWKAGFEERAGQAENGVVYGQNVFDDSEVGNAVGAATKNQLGIDTSFEGEKVKIFITRSGYVEVYQPSSYDAGDFAGYVENEVLPFTNPL